jgi:hypothetical protein
VRIRTRPAAYLLHAILLLAAADRAIAGPASDVLLPQSVVGYASVADPAQFDERWDQTQIGRMLADDIMQPFMEDLREQLDDRFDAVEEKLGITWDDLEGVPSGESSFSILKREGLDAALAITIGVEGHQAQAAVLLESVERRFAARGARHETVERAGTTLHVFDMPAAKGRNPATQITVYFIKDDVLVGIDDRSEAEAMLDRFDGAANDNLQSVPAYRTTIERCRREAGDLAPEVRWFAEPFGFVFAARTLDDSKNRRTREDYAQMFADSGFDAVEGANGHVNLLVEGGVEILHRTSIYAPPTAENEPLRWTGSMRMLQLPNVESFEPQSWVPRMLACYTTFNLDLEAAFDNLGPIFDKLQGHEGAWENTLEGWKVDPYGAEIDVRKEFIENMGQRITVISDYETPISPESERSIIAIEANDEQKLAAALEKWMSEEPDIKERQINGIQVWERVPPTADVEEIDVPGFSSLGAAADESADDEEDEERVLPNSASCVAMGHLIMASDIDYLREILAGYGQHERLVTSADYQLVARVMDNLAPGKRSGWSFARNDEQFRPTYELVRQGRMPEAETMLGRLLNDLLTTDIEEQEGVRRKQRLDGSRLPSFEAVRRYFGPSGRVLRSEQDGWFLSGAMLNKEAG